MFCTICAWPKPNIRYKAVRVTGLRNYFPHFHKHDVARVIGPYLRKGKNLSRNFQVFVEAVQNLLAQ